MKLHKQKGFSLVELMVSITIGLILLAGVVSIFVSSRVTFSTNERTARLQENGRVALDLITHDLRSAGYMGCSRGITFNNTLNNAVSALWNYVVPVQGYENNGSGVFTPSVTPLALSPAAVNDSDVIVLRVATRDGRSARLESNMTSLTGDMVVTNVGVQTLTAGNIFMISDCNAADIFEASAITAGTPNSTISRDTLGTTPGNATTTLGRQYAAGARIIPLQTLVYYVGSSGGEPGLYRKVGATGASQLLVDGVQALQISYGEDTDNDRVANVYRSAAAVTNWNAVISVNIAMLIRSERYGTNIDTKTYTLLTTAVGGKTINPVDENRQRMVFTTTATLRNRAW